jgi:hypothetical protein
MQRTERERTGPGLNTCASPALTTQIEQLRASPAGSTPGRMPRRAVGTRAARSAKRALLSVSTALKCE